MSNTDKTSGRGCAWSIAARSLAGELVADGIIDQPIAREPRKAEGDIVLRFDAFGYYHRANSKWFGMHSDDEPLWQPTIIDPEIWAKAAKAFRPRHDLKYNVEHYLLPEMTDYIESMTDDDLVNRVHEFLLEFGVLNCPIRQVGGNTYFFNDEEIYTLDRGSQNFKYEGKHRFSLFQVKDYTSFNNNVWSKAMKQFRTGMTLTECIRIFLDTKLEMKPDVELPFIDRLIQRIEAPLFERIPENHNEATFDRIRVFVGLPRYMFDSWYELRDAVLKNRAEIDRRVIRRIEEDRQFKKFELPINFIKLSDVTLLRDHTLEYIFELKE